MQQCDRCGTLSGEGELMDEQFLCNQCLPIVLEEAQNGYLLEEEDG